jgi:hypothetical protein
MKYLLKRIEKEENFRPFSLTITFETEEEYENFHDNVMCKLIPNVDKHEFFGHTYRMAKGQIDNAEGKIEVKK